MLITDLDEFWCPNCGRSPWKEGAGAYAGNPRAFGDARWHCKKCNTIGTLVCHGQFPNACRVKPDGFCSYHQCFTKGDPRPPFWQSRGDAALREDFALEAAKHRMQVARGEICKHGVVRTARCYACAPGPFMVNGRAVQR